MRTVITDLH